MGCGWARSNGSGICIRYSYQCEMWQHFPELRLCENYWKAEQIAIDNYPSWRIHYHGTKMKQESSNSSDVNLLNLSEAASLPTKWSQPHSKKNFFPATKKAQFESGQPAVGCAPMGDGNSQAERTSVGTTEDPAHILKVYIICRYCFLTNRICSVLI